MSPISDLSDLSFVIVGMIGTRMSRPMINNNYSQKCLAVNELYWKKSDYISFMIVAEKRVCNNLIII